MQITTPPTTIDMTHETGETPALRISGALDSAGISRDLILQADASIAPPVTLRSAVVSPNDLVDALDLVIQKLDGSLPRFVTVDLDAIRALVKQARG